MMNKLFISPSPHVYEDTSVKRLMLDVVIAMLPALAFSIYFFGMGAIIVTLTAVVSCLAFEWLIQKFILKQEPSITDGSALVTGILLAFNVPTNLPIWIIIIGSLVAIGVGKMSFGGLGNNPFNPALVGRVFLLISFPVNMTSWPVPTGFTNSYTDAVTGATPLGVMKEGLSAGRPVAEIMSNIPSHMELFYGHMGGSMGEIAAIALLLGFGYMLFRKVIKMHIPVSIFLTIAVFT
ncbi:MAG: Na+-transporting NADH:ubiquinone oxidoreductase subunit D, partial [Marinilabiliales bacterium]